jgi:hypothetical protein
MTPITSLKHRSAILRGNVSNFSAQRSVPTPEISHCSSMRAQFLMETLASPSFHRSCTISSALTATVFCGLALAQLTLFIYYGERGAISWIQLVDGAGASSSVISSVITATLEYHRYKNSLSWYNGPTRNRRLYRITKALKLLCLLQTGCWWVVLYEGVDTLNSSLLLWSLCLIVTIVDSCRIVGPIAIAYIFLLPQLGWQRVTMFAPYVVLDREWLNRRLGAEVGEFPVLSDVPVVRTRAHHALTVEQCAVIPSKSYQKGSDMEVADTCAICLTDLEAEELVKQLPCKHLYHALCIDSWLLKRNACPLCIRRVLRKKRPSNPPSDVELVVLAE